MIKDFNNMNGWAPQARVLRPRDIAAFRRYWSAMRKDGDVPRRSDIDPRGIEPLLAEAFVAERIAPGLARLRIAGNHLTDLMGMEVRGMPLSSFLLPAHRDRLADLLVDLFDAPATLELELAAESRPGIAPLTGRMVLMPLRSDLGDISRALGCLVTDGPMGRTPCRFAITRSTVSVIDMPSHGPSAAGFTASTRPDAPQTQAPERNAETPSRSERSYLRLVKSD